MRFCLKFLYRTVRFDIYKVHTPTNEFFIKHDKVLKFNSKSLPVYDHHQGAFTRVKLKLYLG